MTFFLAAAFVFIALLASSVILAVVLLCRDFLHWLDVRDDYEDGQ